MRAFQIAQSFPALTLPSVSGLLFPTLPVTLPDPMPTTTTPSPTLLTPGLHPTSHAVGDRLLSTFGRPVIFQGERIYEVHAGTEGLAGHAVIRFRRNVVENRWDMWVGDPVGNPPRPNWVAATATPFQATPMLELTSSQTRLNALSAALVASGTSPLPDSVQNLLTQEYGIRLTNELLATRFVSSPLRPGVFTIRHGQQELWVRWNAGQQRHEWGIVSNYLESRNGPTVWRNLSDDPGSHCPAVFRNALQFARESHSLATNPETVGRAETMLRTARNEETYLNLVGREVNFTGSSTARGTNEQRRVWALNGSDLLVSRSMLTGNLQYSTDRGLTWQTQTGDQPPYTGLPAPTAYHSSGQIRQRTGNEVFQILSSGRFPASSAELERAAMVLQLARAAGGLPDPRNTGIILFQTGGAGNIELRANFQDNRVVWTTNLGDGRWVPPQNYETSIWTNTGRGASAEHIRNVQNNPRFSEFRELFRTISYSQPETGERPSLADTATRFQQTLGIIRERANGQAALSLANLNRGLPPNCSATVTILPTENNGGVLASPIYRVEITETPPGSATPNTFSVDFTFQGNQGTADQPHQYTWQWRTTDTTATTPTAFFTIGRGSPPFYVSASTEFNRNYMNNLARSLMTRSRP